MNLTREFPVADKLTVHRKDGSAIYGIVWLDTEAKCFLDIWGNVGPYAEIHANGTDEALLKPFEGTFTALETPVRDQASFVKLDKITPVMVRENIAQKQLFWQKGALLLQQWLATEEGSGYTDVLFEGPGFAVTKNGFPTELWLTFSHGKEEERAVCVMPIEKIWTHP